MTARTKEQTRQLMLETGREILSERGVPEEISVKLSDVLARLKLTTGAAYHIWDSQDAYRRDLTLFCARSIEWPAIGELRQLVEDCRADDLMTTVRGIAERYFQLVSESHFSTRLYFWTIKDPSTELGEAASQIYDCGAFVDLCGEIISSYGLQTIDSVDLNEVAATIIALLEGFSLRYHFDPEQVIHDDANVFAKAVTLYLGAVTVPA